MIVETILNALFDLFSKLTSNINIPDFPTEVETYIMQAFDLMQDGIYILNNLMNMQYFLTLVFIMVAIDIGIRGYKFVIWLLKKIPSLSIS